MTGAAWRTGYLGLGSNQGDRLSSLEAAVTELTGPELKVTAGSSVYTTEPVGEVPEQADFLNACVRIESTLDPLPLLELAKDVERRLGRESAGVRHGPRPIDVDVLLLGGLKLNHPRLRLPHPETASRRFVLVPLLELDPDLTLPDGRRLADALTALGADQRVERFSGPLLKRGV